MSLRVGIAGVWHETNTFAPGRTTLDDFAAYVYAEGPGAVREALAGTATEVGGAIAGCESTGLEAVPLFFAGAVPGPLVAAEAWAQLRDGLLEQVAAAGPLDALLLTLHGGMAAEGLEDPESDLLERVRDIVGSLPVAVTLDLHGNPGDGLIDGSDVLLAYDTYPHTDAAERAAEAVGLLVETIEGTLAPLVTGRRLPLLTCPLVQATAESPMVELLARARRLQARPGVVRASLLPGFAYADVERLGFSVVVTGESGPANEAADELASAVWEQRDAFRPGLVGLPEAIARAASSSGQIVLAEPSDNVGGGAPGNSTFVLRALLDAGVRSSVVVIHDPDAAAAAARGGDVELEVGEPAVALRGRVAWHGEASYRRKGSYMTGSTVRMGPCAVVDSHGVEVVLTSRRVMPFDLDHLRAVGIEPLERRVLAVKSAIAWQAAFAELGAEALYLDTPGVTTCALESLPYRHVRRPIVPLDPVD